MRGLDGNYINTQGDVLTRMQVVYQAEQYRQQIRAQLEAADALRKLREEVEEPEKKGHSSNPRQVGNDIGSGRRGAQERETVEKKSLKIQEDVSSDEKKVAGPTRIDIRV